ncbi:MAG TPA: enoyl-CoA hydratase/isomerase family protein [Polyangiaceae bacterium]
MSKTGPRPGDRTATPPNQSHSGGSPSAQARPGSLADEADRIAVLQVPPELGVLEIAALLGQLNANLANASVRVLVLRGSPETFCRGMALGDVSVEPERASAFERATETFADVLLRLREARPITVALVEGPALGGGVGLLAACDFVMACDTASFSLPELRLGLVPAVILPVLAERLSLPRTRRWALTQATWTATEAEANGLVDLRVANGRIDVELRRLQRTLLRAHPRGVLALKSLARQIGGKTLSDAIACGKATLNALLQDEATRRDLVAFRDFGMLPGEEES